MKLAHLLVASAAFVAPVSAQQVVFHDGFEGGFNNWTATGLWNPENATDSCGANVAPFAEGTRAAWYGSTGNCGFSTGVNPNAGSLTLNDWLDLPDAPSIGLHFWMWSETEYCNQGTPAQQFDVHSVTVFVEQPSSTTQVVLCPSLEHQSYVSLAWHERRIDLSAFRGQRVRVSFDFDTVDDIANEGGGWYVDDVQIVAEPGERVCPGSGFSSGCPCLPTYVPVAGGCRNSTNQSAVLYSSGSVSVAGDTLRFRVDQMPPYTIGLLAQTSTQRATTPFGDGLTCTGGPTIRMGTTQASAGVAAWPPPGAPSISQLGQIPSAGGLRFYSVSYRDVLTYCEPATFNVTETQRIQWVP